MERQGLSDGSAWTAVLMIKNTYGSVSKSDRYWLIICEPQVRARLKRVFPRAPQSAADSISLLATAENSRELQWFLQRYPMEMSSPDIEALDRLSSEHVEMEQSLATLVAGRGVLPDCDLAKPARDYQRYAAAQLEIRSGLLLVDDLGLGKTVTAMCSMTAGKNLPTVVVYPAALPNHWPEKLAEFLPNLRVHHIRTGKVYPLIKQPGQRIKDLWDTLPDVVLVSYHKLRNWAETLGEIVQLTVFEEVQQLRSPDSEIYRACKYLASKSSMRLGLTATPVYNYGSEFFHVINVLLPGSLGDRDEFMREWCIAAPGEKARLRDAEQFGAYLRREGIMLRRTRAEVGRELPPLTKVVHEIEADPSALKAIAGNAAALARIILAKNESYRGQKMHAAGELDQMMRQATGVAKAPYVAEFVRLLVESGEPVILFGWHREVYSIWMELLADLTPVLYTGTESPRQKQKAKDDFVSGKTKVLVMSLRSGFGIDGLQHVCRTSVFGELDWSPGVHEQCMGRPHRDGQQLPVMAYFLMAEIGSDPIIADVLGIKREQIEGVRNPGENMVERKDTGERQLRALAQSFLKSTGEALPEENVVVPFARPDAPSPVQATLL